MMNDHKLNQYCKDLAREIFDNMTSEDDAQEQIWERIDGCEYVIYHHKAHEICQNCDVSKGEYWAENLGICDDETLVSISAYNTIASNLAFGELLERTREEFQKLVNE